MKRNLQLIEIKRIKVSDHTPPLLFYITIVVAFALLMFFANFAFAADETSTDPVLGPKNSKVTVIEYGDYQCPYCGQFHRDDEYQLRKEYIDTGRVKFIYRNQPMLGDESIAAAVAAKCAQDQGKFWQYHDELYDQKLKDYKNGGGENDGFFSRDLFLKIAKEQGLNVAEFTQCYDSNKYSDAIKSEAVKQSLANISTVPTVFVNEYVIHGAPSYDELKEVIDDKLKK